ncbi:MAG: response regulator [Proteobacteria bacterium]|nr:response regulator [Pseudomonadota bacterium]
MDNLDNLIKHSKKIKLLYVEDNEQAREATQIILDEFFGEITVAVDGLDGLDRFKSTYSSNKESHSFDIIITDINMPKMNGLDMIENIKKIDDSIPVLVFSAENESDSFVRSIKLGVDGYLLKPIDINQFTTILDKILEKIRLKNQAKKSENLLQQYKEITDRSAIISIIDKDEKIIYANDACCKITEHSREQLVGLEYHLTSEYRQADEIYDDIWSTIRDKKEIWQGVTKYIAKSGKIYYLKNTIKPILDTDGNILEYIALRHDITDIRLAALEREKLLILEKSQADEASQAKSEFLSGMSHELRTPMNAILGFAQILEYDEKLNDDQKDSVHEIIYAGQHLLKLINGVLDLAKIESGHIDLFVETIELSTLLDECFTLLMPMVKKQQISISHVDIEGYSVHADRTRLKQVFINLLSNAIKYNRQQGQVEVRIRELNNKNIIRITVSDTGKGIEKTRLNELFQPFNRLDADTSEIEGTGVGLAITRNLVELMGGQIGVESQLNSGSHFWIELPHHSIDNIKEIHEVEINSVDSPITNAGKQHIILYIEDNQANLKLVDQIMAKQEYIKLISADNAESGLDLARAFLPELILLDINLSKMNGYELLSEFQADIKLKDIPVIAVTANAMILDVEQGKAAGFSDYLTKPLNIEKFISTVDQYLELENE